MNPVFSHIQSKEFHLRDFIAKAEPKLASTMKTSELSSRDIRRLFFGYFRQPPGKKPDKKLATN